MRIDILTREYPPNIYGGAGVHVSELTRALREVEGVEVQVRAFDSPVEEEMTTGYDVPAGLEDANAALRTLGVDLLMARDVADGGADLVHSHTWYANLGGHLGGALAGIPHVISAHSLEPMRPWKAEQYDGDQGDIPEVEMFVGESRVFPAPGVARIAVGNGAILTAAALDDKEVILFANGPGTSSLFIWNDDGRYQRIKINIVPGDTSRIAREIAAFLESIPNAQSSIIGDKVIVEGEGLTQAERTRIAMLAERYPQIVDFTSDLSVEKMIMLDVKVVEFPTTFLRELGLSWRGTGGVAAGGIWSPFRRARAGGSSYEILLQTGGSGSGGAGNAPPFIGAGGGAPQAPSSLNIGSVLNMGLNATLNLLEQDGKATMLAQPQLSARNGASASFLAGGEVPYAVRDIEGPKIEFKQYGVKLDIAPRVDSSGNMHVGIETEVSNIDPSVVTEFGPALQTRRTTTEFNVHQGETIVLSGLIQRTHSASIDKVPFLGDIPILGALFRSKNFQDDETELVVFVTPTVVDAQSPGMVDRIQRTEERLEQRLGPVPYLTEPLQPGANPARLDLVPPPVPVATADTALDSDTVSLRPASGEHSLVAESAAAAALPAPGRAQPAPAVGVGVAEQIPASEPAAAVGPDGSSYYRVRATVLPLLAVPEDNAPVHRFLREGEIVHGLPTSVRGAWTAVEVEGQRGWMASTWLEPADHAGAADR